MGHLKTSHTSNVGLAWAVLVAALLAVSFALDHSLPAPAVLMKEGPGQGQGTSSPIKEFPVPLENEGPLAIAAGTGGTFWVAEFTGGAIAQFFPENLTFHQYPLPGSGHLPAYIAVAPDGNVWFSDQGGTGSIWMFDPSTSNFTEHVTPCINSDPVGVAIDGAGNVWFAEDSCNKLGELVYPSYAPVEYSLPEQNSGPAELAVQSLGGSHEAIWLTESLGNRIAMFDTETEGFTEYAPTVPFVSPVGIVLDGSGDVWVSEHGGSSVVELDPSTNAFTYYPTSPPPASSGYGNSAPATLAIDKEGRLWFVEHFSNKVGRLDSATGTLDEWEIPSAGVYSVLSAIGQKGDFWFTEFTGNKVGTIPGNSSVPLDISGPPASSIPSSVPAGRAYLESFKVENTGSSAVTVSLNVTATFRADGYTTPAEASLNATSLTLLPGEMRWVEASVTPDPGISPGMYSLGVIGTIGGSSSVGVLFLQVTFDFTNAFLYQTLPLLLLLVISVLGVGDLVLFFKVRGLRGPAPEPVWLLVFALVLVLALLLQPPLQGYAKCPGLPGVGSQTNSPSFVATEILLTEVSIVAVLAYLFIRGYQTLKKLERAKSAGTGR